MQVNPSRVHKWRRAGGPRSLAAADWRAWFHATRRSWHRARLEQIMAGETPPPLVRWSPPPDQPAAPPTAPAVVRSPAAWASLAEYARHWRITLAQRRDDLAKIERMRAAGEFAEIRQLVDGVGGVVREAQGLIGFGLWAGLAQELHESQVDDGTCLAIHARHVLTGVHMQQLLRERIVQELDRLRPASTSTTPVDVGRLILPPWRVTVTAFAAALGVSRRRVSKWREREAPSNLDPAIWLAWLTRTGRTEVAARLTELVREEERQASPVVSVAVASDLPPRPTDPTELERYWLGVRDCRRAEMIEARIAELDRHVVRVDVAQESIDAVLKAVFATISDSMWFGILPEMDALDAGLRRRMRAVHDAAVEQCRDQMRAAARRCIAEAVAGAV